MKAAIFDCDGTILDSMPMWTGALRHLISSQGVEPTQEFLDSLESIALYEGCGIIHDQLGIYENQDEAYAMVSAYVNDQYCNHIKALPGAFEFLQSMKDAGVKMIVATSTPAYLVREALAVHKLDQFFIDVVSTEDVGGRDKDYPDVYLEALRRLGSTIEDTWVFEDAPFGIKTTVTAGFKTCAIYNDHDGRDLHFIKQYAHVVSHGYRELCLERLWDFEESLVPTCEKQPEQPDARAKQQAQAAQQSHPHVLIVGGSPVVPSPKLLHDLALKATYIICADRGLTTLLQADVLPDVVCGDADSLNPLDLERVQAAGVRTITLDSQKYATDLAFAFEAARNYLRRMRAVDATAKTSAQHPRVTLTACSGGREDHMLAVWGQLLAHTDLEPCLIENETSSWMLSDDARSTITLTLKDGQEFSVLPLTEACISITGAHWELDHVTLGALSDQGISNRCDAPQGFGEVTLTVHSGSVILHQLRL